MKHIAPFAWLLVLLGALRCTKTPQTPVTVTTTSERQVSTECIEHLKALTP